MTDMTIEQVRDELRRLASDGGFGQMADAIDAHLAKAAQPVAYRYALSTGKWTVFISKARAKFLSDEGAVVEPLYAAPPTAAPAQTVEALDIGVGRDIVKRLRDTPNWLREAWGDFKSAGANKYDRAPKEAADYIETLLAALAHPRPTGEHNDAHVATVYTMEALVPGGRPVPHAEFHCVLPAGTKLYAAPTGEQAGEVAWIDHTPSGVVLRTLGECKRLEDLPHGTKLYAQPRPTVPEGYRLVPVEPTAAMIWDMAKVVHDKGDAGLSADKFYTLIYKAMLAAAQDGEVG